MYECSSYDAACGEPTQKLLRPGSVRSLPEASRSESASRTVVLLTLKSDETSRWDGRRAFSLVAIMSSIRAAIFLESEFQFCTCSPDLISGQTSSYKEDVGVS